MARRRRKRQRVSPNNLVPVVTIWTAIGIILEHFGGEAPCHEVVPAVGDLLDSDWTEDDRQPVAYGEFRWQQRVRSQRTPLCREGLLDWNAPRGVWRLA